MVDLGLPSALRVADRPVLIEGMICTPCTIHTYVTTLAAKVEPLSHCVGKGAKSQRKWPVTGKQDSRSFWVTYDLDRDDISLI